MQPRGNFEALKLSAVYIDTPELCPPCQVRYLSYNCEAAESCWGGVIGVLPQLRA